MTEVLVALFDGDNGVGDPIGGDDDIAPRDRIGSAQISGGLCGSFKALLMSSSHRVRTATARLVTTLCGDKPLADTATCEDATGAARTTRLFGPFVRERLIAAGVTGAWCVVLHMRVFSSDHPQVE